jgi:hypothetical protein
MSKNCLFKFELKESKSKITYLPEEDSPSSSPNPDLNRGDIFEQNSDEDDEDENDNMDNPVDLKMLIKSVLKV